jgi:hypothetical protein
MRAIVSTMIPISGGGSGYEFDSGPESGQLRALVADGISPYHDQMSWVIEKFGSRNAAELELLSTILYAARDGMGRTVVGSRDKLARQVREIKPRFSDEYVKENIQVLIDIGLLPE